MPGIKPPAVQPVARRYTDSAIPALLCQEAGLVNRHKCRCKRSSNQVCAREAADRYNTVALFINKCLWVLIVTPAFNHTVESYDDVRF
jgi:hypothetical protein